MPNRKTQRKNRRNGLTARVWAVPRGLVGAAGAMTRNASRMVGNVGKTVANGVVKIGNNAAHGVNGGIKGLVKGRKSRKNRSNRNRNRNNRH